MNLFCRIVAFVGAGLLQPLALAASPPPAIDPAAPTAPFAYRSAFEGYTPWREAELADWRGVNDEVARVGGHIGIMRGASAAKPAPGEPGQAPVRGAPTAPGTKTHVH